VGKNNSGGALLKLFKKHDDVGYGSLELESFQSLLEAEDIVCDEDVVTTVMGKFRDNRNKKLTCKYSDLVAWTLENCEPLPKLGAKKGEEEKDEDGDEAKSGDDSDEEEEKSQDSDDEEEEKKDEEDRVLGDAQAEFIEGSDDKRGGEFTDVANIREARCVDIVDVTDNAGRTALHICSAIGDAIAVRVLVKFGASREKRANDGESALS
jgi:hypothetical protein